ncbi:unnamed protein product [Arctogadus glacialis]
MKATHSQHPAYTNTKRKLEARVCNCVGDWSAELKKIALCEVMLTECSRMLIPTQRTNGAIRWSELLQTDWEVIRKSPGSHEDQQTVPIPSQAEENTNAGAETNRQRHPVETLSWLRKACPIKVKAPQA